MISGLDNYRKSGQNVVDCMQFYSGKYRAVVGVVNKIAKRNRATVYYVHDNRHTGIETVNIIGDSIVVKDILEFLSVVGLAIVFEAYPRRGGIVCISFTFNTNEDVK